MAPNIQPVLANNTAPIEANDSSHDSGVDDIKSTISSTQSLTDSIREHVYENGRRYHRKSQGKYALPSDETEQDRLDLSHAYYLEMLDGKLSLAAFNKDPANVLDCGTGTGIWALEFGDEHPGSKVVGIDLAPIQPDWVAPNVYFELDDLEKEWTFAENHFDYIHSRNVGAGIRNWERYLRQMYKHCKPGGYVEVSEHCYNDLDCDDGSMPDDSPFLLYIRTMGQSLEKMGMNPNLDLSGYKRLLADAGFVDIEAHTFKCPVGSWPREKKQQRLGAILREISRTGFEAYGKAVMTNYGGLTEEKATEMINECVELVEKGTQHMYIQQWYLVARKPE
ncbi:S-adenosyl-L-methionine-dependent methyltransferase [Ascodesmis nigricans]|uniref:S-adenosyl-L-methionine-dependent methyltransferase n=1 Tax=Ascodesmis nigricans TaxID=341454 RepID=A0A4V3SIM9_9PEZI|nr:S-adenosyl-L-methionine-dependent methyltransferase [Ascodesmis nigricans]